ncbi:MAG: hypothetical protein HKP30_04515 [Myxococcales bacterium]|nr:hypothetical protein [Myxococcales bacterium]
MQDAAALTAALQRLIDDRALRLAMGEKARGRAVDVFSIEAVTAQLESVYRGLLAR